MTYEPVSPALIAPAAIAPLPTVPTPAQPRKERRRSLIECLVILGWSERQLARKTGEHRTQIARYIAGTSPVPHHIQIWLETLVAFHCDNPCPRRRPSPLFIGDAGSRPV